MSAAVNTIAERALSQATAVRVGAAADLGLVAVSPGEGPLLAEYA